MHRLVVTLGLAPFLLLAPTAVAVPGKVLGSVPSPADHPTGLAWQAGKLWVADHRADALVEVDPATGRALRRLSSPGYRPAGLAATGTHLWVGDVEDGNLYKVDARTGAVEETLESPVKAPVALAWTGKALWLAARGKPRIYEVDPADGTSVRTIPVPARSVDGLTWDGRYLWVADRLEDRVYAVDVAQGDVIFAFAAPGPYVAGLAFDGRHLWSVDYQTRRLARLAHDDGEKVARVARRRQAVEFVYELRNHGPQAVTTLDAYLALPGAHPSFDLVKAPALTTPGGRILTDPAGQRVAHHRLANLASGARVTLGWRAEVTLHELRYYPWPHRIGPLSEVPADVRRHLADGDKYQLRHPLVRETVRKVVGAERNPYWIARRLVRWVQQRMTYQMSGGWNAAPRLIERGTGSCSEYSFLAIALLRAAGVPARYVGALVVRKDDASWDDVFHRWIEIYLPRFGWLPVDPQAGDKDAPADQGEHFHHLSPDVLVTGSDSPYLRWTYNYDVRYTCAGRCLVKQEALAEWRPLAPSTPAPPAR